MESTKKAPGRKKVHATASDRQRAYLKRCAEGVSGAAKATDDPGQGVARLSVLLPLSVALALGRLARHNGITKTAMLARLIVDTENAATSEMTDDQIDEFFFVTR